MPEYANAYLDTQDKLTVFACLALRTSLYVMIAFFYRIVIDALAAIFTTLVLQLMVHAKTV